MGRTPETGLKLNGVNFPRCALVRMLMHAVKTEPCAFSGGVFPGWFVACFAGFPSETPKASQAVLITDVMVNVKNISHDKSFRKINTAIQTLMDQELCT